MVGPTVTVVAGLLAVIVLPERRGLNAVYYTRS